MRLNKFIAQATGMSRRAADTAIAAERVSVNGQPPGTGQQVADMDVVSLDGQTLRVNQTTLTLMLHKPAGYVCSRDGQGSRTVYDLLPAKYHTLKPVGRLDKDSSGLLLLTNDGQLAYRLTHPKFEKVKVYQVELDKPLARHDAKALEVGVMLEDGLSRLRLKPLSQGWEVSLHEGRNRQIRRSFAALGYKVNRLHRMQFGSFRLQGLEAGEYSVVA